MTLQVGDVLVSRELYPGCNIDAPVGEIYIHGAWTLIKFDPGALYLVIEKLWDDDDDRFVVELVSLESAYKFKFRTTNLMVNALCEVIRREYALEDVHGKVTA